MSPMAIFVALFTLALPYTGKAPGPTANITTVEQKVFGLEQSDGDSIPVQLSLGDALDLFRSRGFDLLIAEAAVETAKGDVQIAGAVPNPQLSGSIGYSPDGANSPTPSAVAFQAALTDSTALEDTLSGKRRLRLAVAEAASRASRYQRDDAFRTLAYLLKQQFLAVALDEMALQFADTMRSSYRQTLRLFELRFENGDVSEADLARVDVVACAGEQAYMTAEATLALDKAFLAFMLGTRGIPNAFSVPTDWLEGVPGSLQQAPLKELVRQALAHRPDLAAQAEQVERARRNTDLNYRLRFPDVSLNLLYQGQGEGPNAVQPPTYAIGLTVGLPLLYQFQGEITKARADLRVQALMLVKAQAQLTYDVITAFVALNTSQHVVEHMRHRMLERAKLAFDLVRIQYEKGATSLLDFMDAQRNFVATRQMYFENLQALWAATFQMEQALGMPNN